MDEGDIDILRRLVNVEKRSVWYLDGRDGSHLVSRIGPCGASNEPGDVPEPSDVAYFKHGYVGTANTGAGAYAALSVCDPSDFIVGEPFSAMLRGPGEAISDAHIVSRCKGAVCALGSAIDGLPVASGRQVIAYLRRQVGELERKNEATSAFAPALRPRYFSVSTAIDQARHLLPLTEQLALLEQLRDLVDTLWSVVEQKRSDLHDPPGPHAAG